MKWLSRVLGIASIVFTAIPWTMIAIGSSRVLLRIFSSRALIWIDLNGKQMAGLFGLALLLALLAAIRGSRLWAGFSLVPFVSIFLLMVILNRQERARSAEMRQEDTRVIILISTGATGGKQVA